MDHSAACRVTPRGIVLSVFPGVDLLGRAFEAEGYTTVRGPDTLWGGDVRSLSLVGHNCFTGIIGGPPCQEFSGSNRNEPTGEGLELVRHYLRIVTEAQPDWFLMENVNGSPCVTVPGYQIQRFTLNARDCGMIQNRPRKFHFGFRDGKPLVIARSPVTAGPSQPCCMASEGRRGKSRRSFADFCELQGLPRCFTLPGFTKLASYRAVGNGVPIPMGRVIARAITERGRVTAFKFCACHCGRLVHGKQITATAACRKRMERLRHGGHDVTELGHITPAESRLVTRPVTVAPGKAHPGDSQLEFLPPTI